LVDVGEEKIVGSPAPEDDPAVRHSKPGGRGGKRLIRGGRGRIGKIDAFGIQLRLACAQDRLEGLAHKRIEVLLVLQELKGAFRGVAGERDALDVEAFEGTEIDDRRGSAPPDDDRGAVGFINLDFDKAFDEGKVDLVNVDPPPRQSDTPHDLEGLTATAHLSELSDFEETLVKRNRPPYRTFGKSPGQPRSLDPFP
jgi:hypothetical protein